MKNKLLLPALFLAVYTCLLNAQSDLTSFERSRHTAQENKACHLQTDWFAETQKVNPNVFKAQAAYNRYFSDRPAEPSKVVSRFRQWVQLASLYMDEDGNAQQPPFSPMETTSQRQPPDNGNGFGSWNMIGPSKMSNEQCSNNNLITGGFCDRVYVNPYNTQHLFAGFSYGGLWVSHNQGDTWQLSDGNFPNGTNTYANRDYYYGEIAAHKLNPDLVLAATEAGLLKSKNGGTDWSLCPTLNRKATPNARPYFIALSTTDQNVMLSTFGRKLFRSTDGGTTWIVVFDNSAGGSNHFYTSQYNTGTPFGLNDRTYNFFGLEADFGTPGAFYLGAWNTANQACIYKSTDNGATFTLSTNLNQTLGTAWNSGTTLCLKTIPASPGKFFVYEQFAKNKPYYKLSQTGQLLSSNAINAYVEAFDVDWNNESILYQGEYSPDFITKSSDNGVSFGSPYAAGCNYLHADIRGISAVGNIVLVGNDGGIGLSKDAGMSIVGTGFEINSMDIWGFSSSPKSDIVLAGLDHNQTFVRSYEGVGGWRNIKGADAGVCTVNPHHDRWLYFDWAYGVNKGLLNGDGSVTEYGVAEDVHLGSLQFHPNVTFDIFGIKKSNANIVVHSVNNMSTATTFKNFGESVQLLRTSRTDAKVLYALTGNKKMQKTVNNGQSWSLVTPPTSVTGGQTNITAIEIGAHSDEIWAAYGNAQNTCKVAYSNDGGATWTNITSTDLPAVAVSAVAYQPGTNGGVYIAQITPNGTVLWYKNKVMTKWQQVGETLPMMGYITSGLFVVPAKGKIRFGSSRGAWEHDLFEASSVVAHIAAEKQLSKCSADGIRFLDASTYPPGTVTRAWSFPGGTPATSTEEQPRIQYFALGQYDVQLTITHQNGQSQTVSLPNFVTTARDQCAADAVAGRAIDTRGATSISVPLQTLPLKTNTLTFTCWVKPDNLQKSFSQILSVVGPQRLGLGFAFKNYVANTNLVVTYPGNNYPYWITSTLDLPIKKWSHLAMTYSPTSIKVYVDGNDPWEIAGNFPPVDFTSMPVTINGDIHNQGGDFKGEIEEVCVFDRVLTRQEIREKMHLIKIPANETGLALYYQFNQYVAESSTLYDALGTGHPATVATTAIQPSTAPVSSGQSFRIASVDIPGNYAFPNTGLSLDFSGAATLPKGEMVVSRLRGKPSGLPATNDSLSGDYWVVRHWGANAQTSALNKLVFNELNISGANSSGLKLYRRPANDFGATWSAALCNASAVVPGAGGTATFGQNCTIQTFGQFVLSSAGGFVGVEDLGFEGALGVSILPNPVTGGMAFNITSTSKNTVDYALINVLGQSLMSGHFSLSTALSTDRLAKGIYWLVFTGKEGKMVKKVIVE